jgi:coproporphyrinogen III oxidase-like Fe-S oxidoreductase
MQRGASPVAEEERLDDEAYRLERVWLGLRTRTGVPRPEIGSPADVLVSEWRSEGLAERFGERVRLTSEGWLVLDRLAVDLERSDGVRVDG